MASPSVLIFVFFIASFTILLNLEQTISSNNIPCAKLFSNSGLACIIFVLAMWDEP